MLNNFYDKDERTFLTVALSTGDFTIPDLQLEPGEYTVYLTAEDLAGNHSVETKVLVTVAESSDCMYHPIVTRTTEVHRELARTKTITVTKSIDTSLGECTSEAFRKMVTKWADYQKTVETQQVTKVEVHSYREANRELLTALSDTHISDDELIKLQTNVCNELEGLLLALNKEKRISLTVPTVFQLEQNYPNPFNPTTTIRYGLPQAGEINLSVYDIQGRLVRVLVDEHQEPNFYSVVWDGTNDQGHSLPSGLYLYRLQSSRTDNPLVRQMLLLK